MTTTPTHTGTDWLDPASGGLTSLLADLVSCRSDNPGRQEADIARLVMDLLGRLTRCTVTMVDSMPGRPSVAAVLPGRDPQAPTLVLNGHLDTVPVDEPTSWTFPPFRATLQDGLLYGRGACDMKAGLAAQMAVAAILSRRHTPLSGTLVLHFAAGEERAEPGTQSLIEAGFVGTHGIVTEPTDLQTAEVARGLVYFQITIHGRSIHSSRPHEGVNPISVLPLVMGVVDRYAADLAVRHPLLPAPTCTPTQVRGGDVPNMIPDSVCLTVDRRLLPGEDAEAERRRLKGRLNAVGVPDGITLEVRRLPTEFIAADGRGTGSLGDIVRAAAAEVTGHHGAPWGTPYSSDMRVLVHQAGMEAVTFGPGSISQAHAPDEHVAVPQVRDATDVLLRTALTILGERT